jgi:surface protein
MLRRPSGGYDLTKWNSVHNTALRTGSTTILLPFDASTGNRTIDWGDGVVEVVNTANPSHTYASGGIYTVTVSGGTTTRLGNILNAGWQQTVTEVISWGNLGWTSFNSAFRGCTQNVKVPSDSPTTVTNMFGVFAFATAFNQNISSWNTSNVLDMRGMFQSATAFNQNISSWNTSNVLDMLGMFQSATAFNQNISSWNTSNVLDMERMFSGASAFNQNLGAWQLRTAGINMTNMLNNSGLSVENYSRTLIGWANYVSANSNTPATVTLGATGRKYNTTAYTTGLTYNDGAAARAYLVGVPPGWTITDAGQE